MYKINGNPNNDKAFMGRTKKATFKQTQIL